MWKQFVGNLLILGLCAGLTGCDYGQPSGKKAKEEATSKKDDGAKPSKAPEGTTGGVQVATLEFFKQFVVADEENSSLTAAERKNPEPVRGGTLKIRIPSAPSGFNRHLVTQNTATQGEISDYYLNTNLLDRDPETLEYIPLMAKFWKTQDVLDLLPEGHTGAENSEKTKYLRHHGRVVSVEEGVKVVFDEGAWLYTLPQFETEINNKTGAVTQKGGPSLITRVAVRKPGRYTYQVEDISQAKRIVIPWSRLAKKSWSIGKDAAKKPQVGIRRGCRHVFEIRPGFTWHDGKPFTIDDILFTMTFIMKNSAVNAQSIQNYYVDVTDTRALDSKTVQFDWAKPYFLSLSLSGSLEVVPKHVFWSKEYADDLKTFGKDYDKHPFNDKPIGNGPWRFAEWNKASHITLERYDKSPLNTFGYPYFKPQMPYLDKIQFVLIGNSLSALKALTSGDVDLDKDVEPNTWNSDASNTAEFKKNYVRQKSLTPVYTYVGWNLRKPMFQNKLVRQALTMLIPRKEIGKEIHHGLAFAVSGPFFFNSPAYDKSIKPLAYNVKAAKKLLKKAGVVDRNADGWLDYRDKAGKVRTFEFEYLIHNARAYHENIAVKVRENLSKAGIKVKIRKIDWTIFSKNVTERKFDAVRYAWGAVVDPDPYQIWHSSQGPKGSNHVGYNNKEVDQIIERARVTLDDQKRWAMLRRMHRIVADEQPYTFMFCFYTLAFSSQRVRGVKYYTTISHGTDYNQWWIPQRFRKKAK